MNVVLEYSDQRTTSLHLKSKVPKLTVENSF